MGTTSRGEVEVRLAVVSRGYLKTWFPLDFTVVACDWMSLILSTVLNLNNTRFLRFFGGMQVVVNIAAILTAILWLNHLISCAGVALGTLEGDTGMNW